MKKHQKQCQYCKNPFLAKREDAKTCGNACRVRLYRKNKNNMSKLTVSNAELSVTKTKLSVTKAELSVSKASLNVTEAELSVSKRSLNVTTDEISVTENVVYKKTGDEVVDALLPGYMKFCEEEDERKRLLPYTELCCKLCSKNVKVSKTVHTRGARVVCDKCIPQYYYWDKLHWGLISSEGLTIKEAYWKLKKK